MKILLGVILAAILALASPALAQNPQTVKLCVPTSGTACPVVSATAPLPVSGTFSATLAGFTPNGNYGTLTSTASSSGSTALPAGAVVAFQNLSTVDVSCVLSAGAATATTNKLIVRGGATVYYTVGSNVNAACINQTGSASNVVGLAGGAGLGTAFGGGGSGGGGGAVTLASGAVASGAYSAGSIAAGAFVSGSILSGALASGAVVDITNLSTPIAAASATATKGILLGGQYDSTQKTLTNGQQGGVSLSARGAVIVNPGAEAFPVTNAGTFAVQAAQSGTWNVTNISGTISLPTGAATAANQATEISSLATIASNTGAAVPAGTAIIGKVGIDQTTPGTTNGVQVNAALPAGTNTIGTVGQLPYPVGATPLTASATGTTGATTATLAGTSGKTTYICGYSIRANATAAATVTNTITGVITATLSSIMWIAPLASGIGVDEQIFSPCIPASGTNQAIAVVSGAPGSGGTVSSKGWGYQL